MYTKSRKSNFLRYNPYTRISNLYLLLFSSDEEEEEEEMLISEEEIPFKDDPRDETYKPHLERHVSFYSRYVNEK